MEKPGNSELPELIIDGPPWEKRHEIGFFLGFIETIKAFLMYPAKTFSVMRRASGISDALTYTVALQVFAFLWAFALGGADPAMLLPQDPELVEMLDLPANFPRLMVIIYPLSIILLEFITAFSFHLALKWRKLQLYNFQILFRIFAYASGTASLLMLIPGIGGLISFLLTIYITYVGLRTIYGLDLLAFVLSALLALLIAIGLYLGLAVAITIAILFLALIF
ncbi:MAG: hypothetical protein K9M49_07855 [Candidatus Marinimicrobia bacterium]|nr:hypothetical protein [Candidatus Neomarinimicrobiota bacterium]MCF7850470.1 hypothetical protein [Candidatus Neomarinimicrobiota bacterium]MCF7905054.1 hypothetical protein [Candidatus Neomarinimicrobiota bacterium]